MALVLMPHGHLLAYLSLTPTPQQWHNAKSASNEGLKNEFASFGPSVLLNSGVSVQKLLFPLELIAPSSLIICCAGLESWGAQDKTITTTARRPFLFFFVFLMWLCFCNSILFKYSPPVLRTLASHSSGRVFSNMLLHVNQTTPVQRTKEEERKKKKYFFWRHPFSQSYQVQMSVLILMSFSCV